MCHQNVCPQGSLLPFLPIKSTTDTLTALHQPTSPPTLSGLVATHSHPPRQPVPPARRFVNPSPPQPQQLFKVTFTGLPGLPSFLNFLHGSPIRVRQPRKLQQTCPLLSTVPPPRWPTPPSTTTLPPPRAPAPSSPPQPMTRRCVPLPPRAGDFTLETSRMRPPRGS